MDMLKDLFAHKFMLCSRIFVAFAVKDQKVYLVKMDEDFESTVDYNKGDELPKSLSDWHRPSSTTLHTAAYSFSRYSYKCPCIGSDTVNDHVNEIENSKTKL